MKTTGKGYAVGLGVAALLASSIALAAIDIDRYNQATDLLTKGTAVLNSVVTVNKAEAKQRALAVASLKTAQNQLNCAMIKRENSSARCP